MKAKLVRRSLEGRWRAANLLCCLWAACATGELPSAGPALEDPAQAELPADVDRVVWRAGRDVLAGVPAARAAEREREREEALGVLGLWCERASARREPWLAHLRALLGRTAGAEGLYCAAVRVVGALELYEVAPRIAEELADERPSRRRAAAAAALHRLYGRWFATRAEAEPFLRDVHGGAATRLLVRAALADEEVARARLFDWLRFEPLRALPYLSHADPRVREGAARIVLQGIAQPDADGRARDPRPVVDALFRMLESEFDARAYDAALEALIAHVQSAPFEAPEVVRLRAVLLDAVRGPADERALATARGIVRLPWPSSEPEGTDVRAGVEMLGSELESLLLAERELGPMRDALAGTLEALRALGDRAGARAADGLRESPAREPVITLLQDPRRAEVVRAAAVGALGMFARVEDLPLVSAVLDEGDAAPSLAHASLGVLRAILPRFDPTDERVRAVLRRVARLTGAADPDLRRRALVLLSDESLAPFVRGLEPDFLVERLGEEQIPDLTNALLVLVGRLGTPATLPKLLALPGFDALASGERARIAELSVALGKLAGGAPDATFAAARRLVAVPDDATRIFRTERALSLVAGLGESEARALSPGEHRAICSWVWTLHAAGISAPDALGQRGDFARRIVSVHLPQSAVAVTSAEDGMQFGEGRRNHLNAVLSSELWERGDRTIDPGAILAAFERAWEFRNVDPGPKLGDLVLRDRARFYITRQDWIAALKDYRTVFRSGGALENSDLRAAVAALMGVMGDAPGSRRARAEESVAFLTRLVERASWASEPPAVRMQDLRELGQCALDADRPELYRSLHAMLADMPDVRTGAVTPDPARPPRPWHGLLREEAWFQELLDLRTKAELKLRESVAGTGSTGR